MSASKNRETILEFRLSGQFGQINAIDVATGLEASVTVPAATSKEDRERLALKKLSRLLANETILDPAPPQNTGENAKDRPKPLPPKRGIIV
jgi:hypothetical protein